jgi:hypothetical protein
VEEIAIKIIICPELRYRFCSNGWGFTSGDFDANGEGEVVGGIVVMHYAVKMLIKP